MRAPPSSMTAAAPVRRRQVDPELDEVGLAAARRPAVHHAAARGDPLRVAGGEDAVAARAVPVLEPARQHQGDHLDALVAVLGDGRWRGDPVLDQRQDRARAVRGPRRVERDPAALTRARREGHGLLDGDDRRHHVLLTVQLAGSRPREKGRRGGQCVRLPTRRRRSALPGRPGRG
jgi:hypothetical protein